MRPRRASTALVEIEGLPPTPERAVPAAEEAGALDWSGAVRLSPARAAGESLGAWQGHVRRGLFERALTIGQDTMSGPHGERPAAAARLLAHFDALAEAGLGASSLLALCDEVEPDRPGALWVIALLFGTLAAPELDEAFQQWLGSLDPTLLLSYRGVVELAEALHVAPRASLRERAASWLTTSSSEVQVAVALEGLKGPPRDAGLAARLARWDSPLVQAALERAMARAPADDPWPDTARVAFWQVEVPALAFEVARARMLGGDLEPLLWLRQEQPRALDALGGFSLEVLALAGEASDQRLAQELASARPTNGAVLDGMGRVGLASLLPRLLSDLGHDDYGDDAHAALVTALGEPRGRRGSADAWEERIAALGPAALEHRLRGGQRHTLSAILSELGRREHSARDVRARADEVLIRSGKRVHLDWCRFGAPLDPALAELARIAR